MTKIAALLAAAIPFVAGPQEAAAPTAETGEAPAPPPEYAFPPPQHVPPPRYAAPPQHVPAPQPAPPQYAPPAQAAPPGARPRRIQQRGSWYIGFGLGTANGSIEDDSGRYSFRQYIGASPTNVSLRFGVGATLSPRLLLGLDISAARSQATFDDLVYGPDTTIAVQITNYDAVATFFPMGKGLFLRGGAGVSAFLFGYDNSEGNESSTYTGVNATGGVGYAFWLLESFNLTVSLDASAQSYGSSSDPYAPKSSRFWSLGVGCEWY